MNVILIEPDRLLATAYVQSLQAAGHQVRHTVSAEQAVHLADRQPPDVVVIELQLPRHNGVEFLYEFRSYGEWLHIPIVVHTWVPTTELAGVPGLARDLGVCKVLYKASSSLAQLCDAVAHAAKVPA